jgi:hypothetical protein
MLKTIILYLQTFTNQMDITSKCGKYIAKLTDDLEGETYVYKYWGRDGAHEEIKPLYYIVTIYKVDDNDSAIQTPIHVYKECRRGPQTYNMVKAFIRVNGVMWFIGALNYSVKYYVLFWPYFSCSLR